MIIIIIFIFIGIIHTIASANNSLGLQIERNQDQIAIGVILSNEDTPSGMQIPLDLDMSDLGLRVDSASFAWMGCEDFFEQIYRIYEDQDKVFFAGPT